MLTKTHPEPVGIHTELEVISTTITCPVRSHLEVGGVFQLEGSCRDFLIVSRQLFGKDRVADR